MSMLDAFFNKGGTGFKAAKCKTLLKLTIPRIKLLRNRREIQLKQMRKDIAKLLENGQEATARIRVEHIVREENMLAAQEIIELFCELISVRLPIIETQRECPIDLKEAISSICFAAPRCADLTELMQVQMLFGAKYGKEFIAGAAELLPDCGVNRQIIELLSVRAPSAETKMKLLKEIAEEHGLDWDPSVTESEFSKRHDDLLNGPSYATGSNFALPKEEKHEDKSEEEEEEENDSELNSEYDSLNLDLPEVPKFTVTPQSNKPPPVQETGPKNIPFLPPNNTPPTQTITPNNNDKNKNININNNDDNIPIPFPHAASLDTQFDYINQNEPKQFLPFTSSPSLPTESSPVFKSEIHEELSERKTEIITKPSPTGQYSNVTSSETYQYSDIAPSQTVQYSNATPPKVQNWNQIPTLDLQDVLSAARAAADTAERAAAAARAAADLTQTRISDFNSKHNKNNEIKTNLDEEKVVFDRQDSDERVVFDRQDSDERAVFDRQDSNSNVFSNVEMESPFSKESHAPQRVNSLEDDPYDYPNLFGSNSRNP